MLVAVVATFVAWAVHASAWQFICDDAYIAFRYAENLARTGEASFNPGHERVEGYTSPLWVGLLAIGAWLGVEPPLLAPVLTWSGSIGGLVAVVGLGRVVRQRGHAPLSIVDLLPAFVLALVPEYVVWSNSGLETSCAAALVFAGAWAFGCGRLKLAAGFAAAAVLTRPDAALPLAAFGLAWFVAGRPTANAWAGAWPWDRPRRFFVASAIFVVPVLLHWTWRLDYYGEWWPNTWHVKRHGVLLRDTFGVAYIATWAHGLGLVWLLPLAVVLRRRHAVLVLPVASVVAYAWSIGGDFMAYSRFLVVATGCSGLLVVWLAEDGFGQVQRRWSSPFAQRCAMAVAVVMGVGLAAGLVVRAEARHRRDLQGGWLDRRFESVQAMHEFAAVRVAAGIEMARQLPASTRLTVGAAGALPYASRLYAIDAYGLVDPRADRLGPPLAGRHVRPGHQLQAPLNHLLTYGPDLLCHIGSQGSRRPSAKSARKRTGSRDYVWACVDYPAVPDGRAEAWFEPGVYCCLRRRDSAVGRVSVSPKRGGG